MARLEQGMEHGRAHPQITVIMKLRGYQQKIAADTLAALATHSRVVVACRGRRPDRDQQEDQRPIQVH
jgi:hypothetical protein